MIDNCSIFFYLSFFLFFFHYVPARLNHYNNEMVYIFQPNRTYILEDITNNAPGWCEIIDEVKKYALQDQLASTVTTNAGDDDNSLHNQQRQSSKLPDQQNMNNGLMKINNNNISNINVNSNISSNIKKSKNSLFNLNIKKMTVANTAANNHSTTAATTAENSGVSGGN